GVAARRIPRGRAAWGLSGGAVAVSCTRLCAQAERAVLPRRAVRARIHVFPHPPAVAVDEAVPGRRSPVHVWLLRAPELPVTRGEAHGPCADAKARRSAQGRARDARRGL